MLKKRSFVFYSFRKQRVVFFLLILIIAFQIYLEYRLPQKNPIHIMNFDTALQSHIDSLKQKDQKEVIFPFNPNYISFSKGYQLELSVEQIQKIHKYRESGKFINSISEFQKVTSVSSSWIEKYHNFFKFPDWVSKVESQKNKDIAVEIKDINKASAEELTQIRGIGAVLSKRIVKYRSRLKGFGDLDQLYEVYGLDSLVVQRIFKQFNILTPINRMKKKINIISLDELQAIPYLSYEEAKKIVGIRTKKPNLNLKEFFFEMNFDSLKIERLTLYLY